MGWQFPLDAAKTACWPTDRPPSVPRHPRKHKQENARKRQKTTRASPKTANRTNKMHLPAGHPPTPARPVGGGTACTYVWGPRPIPPGAPLSVRSGVFSRATTKLRYRDGGRALATAGGGVFTRFQRERHQGGWFAKQQRNRPNTKTSELRKAARKRAFVTPILLPNSTRSSTHGRCHWMS